MIIWLCFVGFLSWFVLWIAYHFVRFTYLEIVKDLKRLMRKQ